MLKYPIFIPSITNLNDARYCAAMGVDTLGFCFDSSHKNYVEMPLFDAIRGWLSGVKIMAELNKIPAIEGAEIANSVQADYILAHHSVQNYALYTDIPVIYQIILEENIPFDPPKNSIYYIDSVIKTIDLKRDKAEFQHFAAQNCKIILGCGFDAGNINEINNLYLPFGFGLYGENELTTGLKDYDLLGAVFDQIEL